MVPTHELTRDRPIVKGRAALLIIDVQNGSWSSAKAIKRPEHQAAAARAIPNIRRLLDAFRGAGLEVVYTVMENLTADGRDRSLDYKLSGIDIAKGSWEAKVIDDIAPDGDEIVLPKTSSSVFNSTNLDYLLRNIGIDDVFVDGLSHRSMHRPRRQGRRRPRLLRDLRARRLRRRDRGPAPGGNLLLQGLLPLALDRRSPRPRSRHLVYLPLFSTLMSNGFRSASVLRKSVT